MSWDVVLESPNQPLGTKGQARETFLSACERIVGDAIPRRGPTEVPIHSSFTYEVYFGGHKRSVNSVSLGIQIVEGDPHQDPQHPVWAFLRQLREHTGWQVVDTYTGQAVE